MIHFPVFHTLFPWLHNCAHKGCASWLTFSTSFQQQPRNCIVCLVAMSHSSCIQGPVLPKFSQFKSNPQVVFIGFTLSLSQSTVLTQPPDFTRTWSVKLSNLGLNLTSSFAYISSFLGKIVLGNSQFKFMTFATWDMPECVLCLGLGKMIGVPNDYVTDTMRHSTQSTGLLIHFKL